jgi:hypothetical protein
MSFFGIPLSGFWFAALSSARGRRNLKTSFAGRPDLF